MRSLNLRLQNVPSPPIWGSAGISEGSDWEGSDSEGVSSYFFVVTNFVGSPGFLSWSQLRRILVEGMEIGSRSRSHPPLDKINNPGILWDQIYTSKQILESQLGAAVDEFAYPYGSYNATTASTVRLAGYKTARACCFGGGPIGCVCAQSGDGSQ